MGKRTGKNSSDYIIRKLSSYISRGSETDLRDEIVLKAKHHVLDTLAAIVSGSILKPGRLAIKYARRQGGVEEAKVIGSEIITSAVNAALLNGIMAHADETDDVNLHAMMHPGCAIVPAALAMAEKEESDGMTFLRGVVLGYDIGGRVNLALGPDLLRRLSRAESSIGCIFGSAAAGAAIGGLRSEQVAYVLSYTAQQASGVNYWARDEEHIEKAFVFGGMPARNAVTAVTLVQAGFTGVTDPFSGPDNFLQAFSPDYHPERLVEELGSRYEIMLSGIKRYSVGAPIQAPLDALFLLMERHRFTRDDVRSIVVRLPSNVCQIVDNRTMPNINVQHILAITLLDRGLTFESSHSYERMKDPKVLEMKKRITLIGDEKLAAAEISRQGIVEVITKDGTEFKEHVVTVRGSAQNPMNSDEVEEKCLGLIVPVLGKERSRKLIDGIWNLENIKNVRSLRPFFSRLPRP